MKRTEKVDLKVLRPSCEGSWRRRRLSAALLFVNILKEKEEKPPRPAAHTPLRFWTLTHRFFMKYHPASHFTFLIVVFLPFVV